MGLRSLFDSIVANTSEARKCYDMGKYAESAQLCELVHEESRSCIQALQQAVNSQNPENPVASGESSMERTPPQMFSGGPHASLKRKPSLGRPQSTKKTSRPSSPPLQRQLAPLKTEQSTSPSTFFHPDFSNPQPHHIQAPLVRPQAILTSQSLPQDLNLLSSQGVQFITPQFAQPSVGAYPNPPYSPFRSQPGTPYATPGTLRATPQMFQSPTMDFSQQSPLGIANPVGLIDPRSNVALQFRRPSEPAIPTHSQLSHTPVAAPAVPTINLTGQLTSFPATPPSNMSGTEAPFPPSLLPQLHQLFLAFLQKVLSDEAITDSRGEALHHPLPPRKQQKVHSLPPTSWRPIKLRIQAFTAAFQEELARRLAAGMNLARHEVSIKRVREYLWTQDLIARYNPSGRKAKSRGSHVWCVEARKRSDDPNAEWEFRPWKRKIQIVRDSLVAAWGQLLRLPFKVWDPQVTFEDLTVKFSVRGQLPSWLEWENNSVLTGRPPIPADEEPYKVPIAITASYTAYGMSHIIESRLELDIRSPGSGAGDLVTSLQSATALQPPTAGNIGVDSAMESYLDDDDDDDLMYLSGQNQFSSENTTPPSGVTAPLANPLFYVPSQSLQNSPLKHSPIGPTPPPSGPMLSNMASMNSLTPTLSPTSLQFNQATVVGSTPRQPTSAPQTPVGDAPSHLSLQIHRQAHDVSSRVTPPAQQGNPHFMSEVQPSVVFSLPNHTSPHTNADSAGSNRMYGIDDELGDHHSISHGYFDESYPVELGSPFLER